VQCVLYTDEQKVWGVWEVLLYEQQVWEVLLYQQKVWGVWEVLLYEQKV
jgi:hypothetical protein